MDLSSDQKNDASVCVTSEIGVEEISMENEKSAKEPEVKKKGTFETFLEDLEKQESPENKISFILQFMEVSISQAGTPSFRNFWEARKRCLDLFKAENLSYAVRTHLWSKYVELSKEAHRLKEVLDEQSAFAAEQIKLAIEALENDLDKMSDPGQHAPEITFDPLAKFMESRCEYYVNTQRELALLNTFAARINGLRKELIKTDMRIRFKNALFQRLSKGGDLVFPRRKQLIKEISQQFNSDVDQFIEENFSSSTLSQPLFVLRDDIKALQNMAKVLTLNTQSFNQTRMKLSSQCWDRIKKLEKERKKERTKLQASFKEGAAQIEPKLKELEELAQSEKLDEKRLDEVHHLMREVRLSREDVKQFRDRLNKLRNFQADKELAEKKARLDKQRKLEEEKKAQLTKTLEVLENLVKEASAKPLEETVSERDRLKNEFSKLELTKWEQHDVDRQFKLLEDECAKMKIDNLSSNDKEAYDQLQELLNECRKRRAEIKDQLEEYRKTGGSSGLDFEQALKHSELVEAEKQRLTAVDEEIADIKKRIGDLSNKI